MCKLSSKSRIAGKSAVFSSRAKCNAEIVLRDEHGEDQFLCRIDATQDLRANPDPDLLARAVIEIALMAKRPLKTPIQPQDQQGPPVSLYPISALEC
jgi:beta-phosphoglucomutase-like phosphatase (HAD superfamily)